MKINLTPQNKDNTGWQLGYLFLVIPVLDLAVWMIVALVIERLEEGKIGPVSISLVSHVVGYTKGQKNGFYDLIFHSATHE